MFFKTLRLNVSILVMLFLIIGQVQGNSQKDTSRINQINRVLDQSSDLYNAHRYEDIIRLLEDNLDLAEGLDSLKMTMCYKLTLAYARMGRGDKSFEYTIAGLLLAQKTNDHWILLSLYRELGSWHDRSLDDQETALFYMKKAIPYLDAVGSDSKCGLMMDIGQTCVNAGQLDSAAVYYDQAFKYMYEDTVMKADLYSFYAPFLVEIGEYDKAEEYMAYVHEKFKLFEYTYGLSTNSIDYSELKYYQKKYSESMAYAQDAIKYAEELDNIYLIREALEWLAKSQDALGLTEQSLESYKKLNTAKDSITTLDKIQELDQKKLSIVADNFKKDLDKINQHNQKLEATVSKTQKALIGTSLALIIGGFLFFGFRKSKNQQIEELHDVITLSAEQSATMRAEYDNVITELDKNRRELTSSALFIEKKNETIKSVRKMLSQINTNGNTEISEQIRSAHRLADKSLTIENNWESFRYFFEQVYPAFYTEIKKDYPALNQNELRLLSYIKMGLTDKESARLLGINTASFQKSKYRLKKKMNLPKSETVSDMIEKY